MSTETAWDLGFIYAKGKSRALIGVGSKRYPDKIVRTFIHRYRDQIFYREVIENEYIWDGLGHGIKRCWDESLGDVEKTIDRLQDNIVLLDEVCFVITP